MRSLIKLLVVIIPVTFVLMMSGCIDEPVNDSLPGRLNVQLTDAPFPSDLVAEANVTINKIEIRKSDDSEGYPFIILSEEEMSFNLLDLTNGVTATLVDMEVPSGSYNLIRLYVSEASIVLSDSSEFDLFVPSGAETGIKIYIDPAIVVAGGLTTELLLDFDVSRSFEVQGNPDTPAGIKGFHFKPVIKASNLSTTGSLSGMVTDSTDSVVDGALVSVLAADTVYTSSLTDSTGYYTILGIDAGAYNVKVEYSDYQPVIFENIEIFAGNTTVLDAKLTD
ncbi:MAG: DUF4382 domain-containing protein [Bacteroidota bacterium]